MLQSLRQPKFCNFSLSLSSQQLMRQKKPASQVHVHSLPHAQHAEQKSSALVATPLNQQPCYQIRSNVLLRSSKPTPTEFLCWFQSWPNYNSVNVVETDTVESKRTQQNLESPSRRRILCCPVPAPILQLFSEGIIQMICFLSGDACMTSHLHLVGGA